VHGAVQPARVRQSGLKPSFRDGTGRRYAHAHAHAPLRRALLLVRRRRDGDGRARASQRGAARLKPTPRHPRPPDARCERRNGARHRQGGHRQRFTARGRREESSGRGHPRQRAYARGPACGEQASACSSAPATRSEPTTPSALPPGRRTTPQCSPWPPFSRCCQLLRVLRQLRRRHAVVPRAPCAPQPRRIAPRPHLLLPASRCRGATCLRSPRRCRQRFAWSLCRPLPLLLLPWTGRLCVRISVPSSPTLPSPAESARRAQRWCASGDKTCFFAF